MARRDKLLKAVSYMVANKGLGEAVRESVKEAMPDEPDEVIDDTTKKLLGKATLYHDANKKPL